MYQSNQARSNHYLLGFPKEAGDLTLAASCAAAASSSSRHGALPLAAAIASPSTLPLPVQPTP